MLKYYSLESAWLFTRDREANGPVLQRAYGILDRFRISRTFFVKSDQGNCDTMPAPIEAEQTKGKEETKSANPLPVIPVEATIVQESPETVKEAETNDVKNIVEKKQ